MIASTLSQLLLDRLHSLLANLSFALVAHTYEVLAHITIFEQLPLKALFVLLQRQLLTLAGSHDLVLSFHTVHPKLLNALGRSFTLSHRFVHLAFGTVLQQLEVRDAIIVVHVLRVPHVVSRHPCRQISY